MARRMEIDGCEPHYPTLRCDAPYGKAGREAPSRTVSIWAWDKMRYPEKERIVHVPWYLPVRFGRDPRSTASASLISDCTCPSISYCIVSTCASHLNDLLDIPRRLLCR